MQKKTEDLSNLVLLDYVYVCLGLFFLSLILTFLIKKIFVKKLLLVIPNSRSAHIEPTPHGGGIAIAIVWFIGLFYLFLNNQISPNLFYALMLGLIISAIGYLDDLINLKPYKRLLIQAVTAVLGLYLLGGLQQLDFGIFEIKNHIITNIFGFLMIIWFINVYNFLDGIDGYAATEAIFLTIAGFFIFKGNYFLFLTFSVFGFLIWNWHKAKIFMGDVGSTLLGYNIAVFTIYETTQNSESLLKWAILFGIFWFDATITLFRRLKQKQKISQSHNQHAYQRLADMGWKHSKVVLFSIPVNLILFIIVFFVKNIFVAFLLSLIILFFVIKLVDWKEKIKK